MELPKTISKTERDAIKLQRKNQTLPSKWEMFKNLIQAAREAVASGLDVRGPEETEAALKTCAECPKLIDDGGSHRCGVCGCVLQYKVKLKAWHCPIDKW